MSLEPWVEKQGEKHVVRWRDAGGKKNTDIYRYETKREAKDRKDIVKSQIVASSLGRVDAQQPAEACAKRFFDYLVQTHHSKPIDFRCAVKLFFAMKDAQGNRPIHLMSDITRVRLLDFMSFLQGDDYSQHTVQTYMGLIRKWLGWAIDHQLLAEMPYKNIHVPTPKKIERYLTDKELMALEFVIENEEYRGIFRLGYVCGLRPAEIRRIKVADILWDDVLQKGELSIPRDETKTDTAGRIIPLPSDVYRLIPRKDVPFDLWTENKMDNYFTKIKRLAKLEDKFIRRHKILKTFYWTRHTYARRFLEDGGGLKLLSYRMGHTTISMTSDVYGHLERINMADEMLLHSIGWRNNAGQNNTAGQIAGHLQGKQAKSGATGLDSMVQPDTTGEQGSTVNKAS